MPNLSELTKYLNELSMQVSARSGNVEQDERREDVITEVMIECMIDASEVSDGRAAGYKGRGMRVNGYCLSDEQDVLDLFVCDFSLDGQIRTASQSDVDSHVKRARNYFIKARDGAIVPMEAPGEAADMALLIRELRESIVRVRIFLFTDRIVRVGEMPNDFADEVEFSYHIWDLERLYKFESSGRVREKIEINFTELFGAPLKCLAVPNCADTYRCYMTVLPASYAIRLYSIYGPRLLERNVRSFLQVKGNINKGIRKTLLEQPEMFLAYNNGLSAVAQEVTLSQNQDGYAAIEKLVDFQIVNGGQTTGSIYDASRKSNARLDNVLVPLKLTEITDLANTERIAPEIARCANSQNKINTADFSANDPFHIRLEELSRTVWAPARQGTQRLTKWFYERARGQYFDARARAATPAKVRDFEKEYPKAQVFTKTDLAKYEHSWDQLPHWVSRGSQKNFSQFTIRLAERGRITVDEQYFQRLVAKAILFRQAERIVSSQSFGGYRANIVTFTIAWLSHHTAQRINFDLIWRQQDISEMLAEAIKVISQAAHEHITHPPDGANITEWCKKERCWELFKSVTVVLPPELAAELDGGAAVLTMQGTDRGMENPTEEEQQIAAEVVALGAETWFQISRWARETSNLAAWQRELAYGLGQLIGRGRYPSRKQAVRGKEILEEAMRLGFIRRSSDLQFPKG
jgi:hypothetical protein